MKILNPNWRFASRWFSFSYDFQVPCLFSRVYRRISWVYLGGPTTSSTQTDQTIWGQLRSAYSLLRSIPSREFTGFPPWEKENHRLKMPFLGDMLVPWRVCTYYTPPTKTNSKFTLEEWCFGKWSGFQNGDGKISGATRKTAGGRASYQRYCWCTWWFKTQASSSSGLPVEIPQFRRGFIHLIYGLLAFPDIEDVFPVVLNVFLGVDSSLLQL